MNAAGRELRFLYSLQASGIKKGLGNIRALLSGLGHPERWYPSIHVAGTNGKGSTAAMIAACLTAAGFRTGLYTSPHLVDFRERMRIDGRKIPASRLAAYTRLVRPGVLKTRATFFEAATAIAFCWFADEAVDIAVIETGLGGRWDSTNVVNPLVSVITSIGLEHREHLGNTLRKIAFEKAGIVKGGVPCVVGDIRGDALDVIRKRTVARGARLVRAFATTAASGIRHDHEGLTGDFGVGARRLRELRVAARGGYQEANVRVALSALHTLGVVRPEFRLREPALRKGFGSLRRAAGFAGRMHVVRRHPQVIVDVAHNPDGIRALVGSLRALRPGRYSVVFGVVREKEFRPMIDLLRPVAQIFHFVKADTDRARDPADLLEYAHRTRSPARIGGSVERGLRAALGDAHRGQPILITGSHYVVGEALSALGIRV